MSIAKFDENFSKVLSCTHLVEAALEVDEIVDILYPADEKRKGNRDNDEVRA